MVTERELLEQKRTERLKKYKNGFQELLEKQKQEGKKSKQDQ